jgi:hypothetical protein
VLNPLEDSRAGHSSADEECIKEIVWPKIVMAQREERQRRKGEQKVRERRRIRPDESNDESGI